ncbi:beta-ketoacyl synthase N-terminal-like domain-containing protein [Streptomyces sp. NPDC002851]
MSTTDVGINAHIDNGRRAVITGLGVAAPSGLTPQDHWDSTTRGESHIDRITLFDPSSYATQLAGEIPDFDHTAHVPSRLAVQTDRWTHLALYAADQALKDAALDPAELPPFSMSVALASSSGGNLFGQKELQRLWAQPTRTVGAYQSIAWFYAATVGQISIRHQMKGASTVLVAEAAGGLDSLAHAVRSIRRGTDIVLAGGTEAPIGPYALACQARGGRLSTATDPARAYRPFAADAAGHVPGEGGAVFVVEALDHALARGATIYAEVTGWGATHDGEHTRRGSGGSTVQYARAMDLALETSGVTADTVDLVFPDAVAVPEYDLTEVAALRKVFGPAGPAAVSTHKPLLGRAYQGSVALDVATALLAVTRGELPPAGGVSDPAPDRALNFVREARPAEVRTAMVNARGFDGFNGSLIVRAYDSDNDTATTEGETR